MSRLGRWITAAAAIGVLATALLLPVRPASAHANLLRSSPEMGAVLDTAPGRLVLWFSEPLVPSLSGLDLLDQGGRRVSLRQVYVSPTEATALIGELPELANGTYTVAWRNTSTVDGHSVRGSFAFSVGEASGAVSPQSVQVPLLQNGADPWVRWIFFAAASVLAGGLLFELLISAPILAEHASPLVREAAGRVAGRTVSLLLAAALIAILASCTQLLLQSRAAGGGLWSGAGTVVGDTRWGQFWALRTALLALAGLAVALAARGRNAIAGAEEADDDADQVTFATESFFGPVALLMAIGALVLTSLMGHSAAVPAEIRLPALATDVLHLLATAAWAGGLAYLALNLPVALARLRGSPDRVVIRAMVDRFSLMAMLSIGAVVITGLFSGWVHVTRPGAVASPYGWALVAKVMVVAVLLAVAAVNAYVLRPRLNHDDRAGARMKRLVFVEVVAAALVLLGAGWLASLEPARAHVARIAAEDGPDGKSFQADVESGRVEVTVRPGTIGVNRVTVGLRDRRGAPVTNATDVRVRLVYRQQDLGAAFISGKDNGGGQWVIDGLPVSLSGSWQVEVTVVRPDAFDARAAFGFEVVTSTLAQESGRPARDATYVLFGVEIALLGVLAVVSAAPKWQRERRTATALGGAGAAATVVGVLVAALTYTGVTGTAVAAVNPVLPTEESVGHGRGFYAQNCSVCHGASGTGDGPEAASLANPPADLTVHVPLHADAVLFGFIRDGIPSRGMPPASGQLNDTERWDLVNYLRALAEGR